MNVPAKNIDIEIHGDGVDWEVELVVVIGPEADRVAEADAWRHIAGLTIGQDISHRPLHSAGGPVTRIRCVLHPNDTPRS